jgi:ligand-binding SRPBCC domain-containing protein
VPVFEASTSLGCSAAILFDFITRPANLIRVSPPELDVKLSNAPEIIELGTVLTVTARHWGFRQRMITQVVKFEAGRFFIEEQRHGPFKKMAHYHAVEVEGETARMIDRIEYEPPGGPLGIMLTAARLEKELAQMYAFRIQKFKEILEAPIQGT